MLVFSRVWAVLAYKIKKHSGMYKYYLNACMKG